MSRLDWSTLYTLWYSDSYATRYTSCQSKHTKLYYILQVPSEYNYEAALFRFINEEIPAFGLTGVPRLIEPREMYDIDDDARLVYNYLQAYKSGRINSLYNPGTK